MTEGVKGELPLDGQNERYDVRIEAECKSDGGPGSWTASIVRRKGNVEVSCNELSNAQAKTSKGEMALKAAIAVLEKTISDKNVPMTLTANVPLLINGMNFWIETWKLNDWTKANSQSVRNPELWKRLDALAEERVIIWGNEEDSDNASPLKADFDEIDGLE